MPSFLTHLECSACGSEHDTKAHGVCEKCGRPLLARYDLAKVGREHLLPRRDLWRYEPVLPVADPRHPLSLGEGGTPMRRARGLEESLGIRAVHLKDESVNPMGSFKARGMAVAVSRAADLGLAKLAAPSAGNAGLALAAYAAAGRLRAHVAMPKDTPPIYFEEARACGAEVIAVDGLIDEAGKAVAALCADGSWFNLATMREPYRVEGKKTMLYETWEALGGFPDWIVFPTGGGTGVVGMWKAAQELRELGWCDDPMPKLLAVQSSGCAPLARAWNAKADKVERAEETQTRALGLRVPQPFAGSLILKAVRESGGEVLAVPEQKLREGRREMAALTGTYPCYESAAAYLALRQMARVEAIAKEDEVVLFNTGTGSRDAF